MKREGHQVVECASLGKRTGNAPEEEGFARSLNEVKK